MNIISRQEAKNQGLKRYFTGKPCPWGHTCERYSSNSKCIKCCKYYGHQAKTIEYNREYRKAHRAESREYYQTHRAEAKEYYQVHRAEAKERSLQYYKDNKEKFKERGHKYRKTHKAEIKERGRKYDKAHRTERREYEREYEKSHRTETRARSHRRRALKNNAEGDHTADDIKWLLGKQKYKCIYCKKSLRKKYHVDHIIALSKGGGNGRDNLQILCPNCNQRKHTKDPIVFAQEMGLLL